MALNVNKREIWAGKEEKLPYGVHCFLTEVPSLPYKCSEWLPSCKPSVLPLSVLTNPEVMKIFQLAPCTAILLPCSLRALQSPAAKTDTQLSSVNCSN